MFCDEAVIDWACFGYLVSSEKIRITSISEDK